MKLLATTLTALALVAPAGCANTTLRAYNGWGIAHHPTPPPAKGRTVKTGHLLEAREGLVLAVDHFDPGGLLTFDDERCQLVFVELPREALGGLPSTLVNPRAYLRRWGCAWANLEEESATSGQVEIKSRTGDRIKARINLQFPSLKFRESGVFSVSAPDAVYQGVALDEAAKP